MSRDRESENASPEDESGSARPSRREFLAAATTLVLGAACSELEPRADAPQDVAGDTSDDTQGVDLSDAADASEDGAEGDLSPVEPELEPVIELDDLPDAPSLPGEPFTLGIASGDPAADGFVLWTRLAPEPLAADGLGGMPSVVVPVVWEVAFDEAFTRVVAAGWVEARPQHAHSVHVTVSGLAPDWWYFYRFRIGDQHVSAVGRARTFPQPGAATRELRLGIASCQNFTHGYYTAHAHLATESLDVLAFLGDYIYEGAGSGAVRSHGEEAAATLASYRRRYALYKLDPDLQASHAARPWITTWDDHEVVNNYAGTSWRDADGGIHDIAERRAQAYQVWYEHQPVRLAQVPEPPFESLRIFRRLRFGDLATFHVLDGRQYRTLQPCDGEFGAPCEAVFDPARTMLGEEQRDWLIEGLREAQTSWNVVAQQTVFAPMTMGGSLANVDQWDGYVVERDALLGVFGEEGVGNVLVATGDIHTAGFMSLHEGGEDVTTRKVGVEVVSNSISSVVGISGFNTAVELIERGMKHFHYFDASRRGYAVVHLTHEGLRVDFRAVSTALEPTAEVTTRESWRVEAGSYAVARIRERDS